jgi:hypothetical protein
MGDDLHLRSRPGEGSEFYFSVVFQTDQTNEMVNSREFSKDRKPPPVITNASLPPKAQLQTLSEMARLGDITGILEMTRTLAAAGSDPAGFAETLHQMAKACRIEQLKRFLKTATDEKDEKKNP